MSGDAEPLRGKQAFAELVPQSLAFPRPLRFDFAHIAVDGDHVLAEWTIAIERRDTARTTPWSSTSVREIRDGGIHSWRESWNPAEVVPGASG